MNTDVEDRLHRDLPAIADRADGATVDLDLVMGRVGQRRRRRAAARGASAVCGLALLVGGLVAVTSRGGSDDAEASNPDAGPTRTEVPLTRLELGSPPYWVTDVTKSVAQSFDLANGERLTFYVTASAWFDTYNQQHCRQLAGFGACWPVPASTPVDAMPWTDLELAGVGDSVMWIGLPETVAVVEIRQGDDVIWQNVVDGVAAFPLAERLPTDEYVALDDAGNEVIRTTWSTVALVSEGNRALPDGTITGMIQTWSSTMGTAQSDFVPDVDATVLEGMTQADEEAYRAFADGEMRSCLARDGDAAWNACLVSTDAAVKAYLADR